MTMTSPRKRFGPFPELDTQAVVNTFTSVAALRSLTPLQAADRAGINRSTMSRVMASSDKPNRDRTMSALTLLRMLVWIDDTDVRNYVQQQQDDDG